MDTNKIKQCSKFEYLAIYLGLIAPMSVFALLYYPFTDYPQATLSFIITVVVSSLFIRLGRSRYEKNDSKVGDIILYLGGVITIILVAVSVRYSGGMEYSLLRDYFLFIPAAVAIIFRAKFGLAIILVVCFVSIWGIYTYPFYAENTIISHEHGHNWFIEPHLIVYAIHFIAIFFLEQEHNKFQHNA